MKKYLNKNKLKSILKQQTNGMGTCVSSWMFTSEGGDMTFRLLQGEEVLVSRNRVPSHKEIQSGHLVCQPDTTFTLEFDNSFSLLRSKTVKYKVSFDNLEELTRDQGDIYHLYS